MFCFKCGEKLVKNASFCHQCGTDVSVINKKAAVAQKALETVVAVEAPQRQERNGSETYFMRVFARPLFLVATILFSICALFSCVIFISDGLVYSAVIYVLTAISMWGLYKAAKAKSAIEQYKKPLNMVRIVALINYIVGWIAVGELALLGINTMCAPLFMRSGHYGYMTPFMNHTNRSGGYVVIGVIIMLVSLGYVFVNLLINRSLLQFVKGFVANANQGRLCLRGFKKFRVKLLILAGINAAVSIVVFLTESYISSISYFLSNYYVSGIEVVKNMLPTAVMVAAVCCLVVCLTSPRTIKENIVDNSKKDDII